ncbi:hypothetical protein DPEC_G00359070 [Dallia pectoralis]|uniref:Uncharacterized protein n=1 Tax=Dallia pectoralis TaxID=75939 RepID=A0ACC2F0F5_DALPE|nr:hypothetical protein DPEC_G00359070 [Dallia pectoralis]
MLLPCRCHADPKQLPAYPSNKGRLNSIKPAKVWSTSGCDITARAPSVLCHNALNPVTWQDGNGERSNGPCETRPCRDTSLPSSRGLSDAALTGSLGTGQHGRDGHNKVSSRGVPWPSAQNISGSPQRHRNLAVVPF